MCNRRGFTTTRLLIALLIVMSVLPICVKAISLISDINIEYDEVEDEIALLDLRRILLISYDLEIYDDHLEFIYNNQDNYLELVNERLVLSPGYQMFLDKIDYLEFYEEGNAIWMTYEKKGKRFETPIVKRNGIYLDDFSDSDDDGDQYCGVDE